MSARIRPYIPVSSAMPSRIHVLGASGSGTTSLAAALAQRHGHRHLDTDDYFWLPTDPPYRDKRPRTERRAMLERAVAASPRWVLSGSLCEWGDPLIPLFDLVVFLVVPTAIRMERLRARELRRYGPAALAPGGALHHAHVDFLDWAGRYDDGGLAMRSRALHEGWLSAITCRVLRLDGDRPVAALLGEVERDVRISRHSAEATEGTTR